MEQWRRGQHQLPVEKIARKLFEQHLHSLLNQAQIPLKDGSSFDLRSLTVFLLNDSLNNTVSLRQNPTYVTVMTLGVLPIYGKKNRALHILFQALQTVREVAADDAILFGATTATFFK